MRKEGVHGCTVSFFRLLNCLDRSSWCRPVIQKKKECEQADSTEAAKRSSKRQRQEKAPKEKAARDGAAAAAADEGGGAQVLASSEPSEAPAKKSRTAATAAVVVTRSSSRGTGKASVGYRAMQRSESEEDSDDDDIFLEAPKTEASKPAPKSASTSKSLGGESTEISASHAFVLATSSDLPRGRRQATGTALERA